MEICIFDKTLTQLCILDEFDSVSYSRKLYEVGEFTIELADTSKIEYFSRGNFVMFDNDTKKIGVITEISHSQDDEDDSWTVSGKEAKGLLERRITLPPTGSEYDSITGAAEKVIKTWIDHNIVNAADSDRNISILKLRTNQNRGNTGIWQTRYDNLSTIVTETLTEAEIGLENSIDIDSRKIVLDTIHGEKRVYGADNAVILSKGLDTISSGEYNYSDENYKNIAIVGGQGEGTEREIVTVGSETGLDRREMFVDARDISSGTSDLQTRGQQKLNESKYEQYISVEPLQSAPKKFGVDYFLGDIITVRFGGFSQDARIIAENHQWGNDGYSLELEFDQSYPLTTYVIANEIKNIKQILRTM